MTSFGIEDSFWEDILCGKMFCAQVFEKFGRVAKVTVVKDKASRESKGVAFILFIDRASAHKAVKVMNDRELFGRKLKCTLARDNGRAKDYIRRKIYKDKSFCYECGEEGHLSYSCPKNTLGERVPPEPKKRKRKQKGTTTDSNVDQETYSDYSDEEYSLSDAIRHSHQEQESEQQQETHLPSLSSFNTLATPTIDNPSRPDLVDNHPNPMPIPSLPSSVVTRKKLKQDSYFSDEDASDSN